MFVRTSHDTWHQLFYGLDESAKVISDAKISEVDGILQEFKQSQSISYSDKMEQANKAELDYLNSSLRILRGREELIRLVNESDVIEVFIPLSIVERDFVLIFDLLLEY